MNMGKQEQWNEALRSAPDDHFVITHYQRRIDGKGRAYQACVGRSIAVINETGKTVQLYEESMGPKEPAVA